MRTLYTRRILRFFSLIAMTLGCCLLQPSLLPLTAAQPPSTEPAQLVQQGVEAYRLDRYQDAIAHWEQALAHLSMRPRQVLQNNGAIAGNRCFGIMG
ncbi:MAG: hypothetical protein AAFQ89_11900 [Cyanobacteria bacterium J06626_18]